MATVDYPSGLPVPNRDSYAFQAVSPFRRTEMTTGRARQRRTFTSVPTVASLSFVFSTPEAQVFEGWFAYQITDGADWFNVDLLTPTGNMQSYECRFTEMYAGPELFGVKHWKFTAPVELRERPILSPSYGVYGAEFVLQSDIIDIALNSFWPAA